MRTVFDHLVVAAVRLDDGAAWVRDRLGVEMAPGGRHARMGTHNRLLRVGPGRYMEVIAVDPNAPAPDRPRWFGLDDPALQARLAREPRIVGWVARTLDIARTTAGSTVPFGGIETMFRGELSWRITIPPDGRLPEGGALPSLIQWPADRTHPAESLPDVGCHLRRLEIGHPDRARIEDALAAIDFEEGGLVRIVDAPHVGFTALIDTPQGLRRLASREEPGGSSD